jgi:topoisomerase IA-like protein
MASKREDISAQAIELWKKTLVQFDEISKSLKMGSVVDRIKADGMKLIQERDRLFARLGEETYKLIDKNKIKVPDSLKNLYDRIRGQADKLIGTRKTKKTSKKKTAKKPAKRKVVKKKTAKRKTAKKSV